MKPTTKEVRNCLVGTVRHVQHIEYYLEQLELGNEDPERPHDIVGIGNKFEWEVIKGFAVQYRDRSQEYFDQYVLPSLERHRLQHHHVKFNNPNPTSTDEDMRVGAVDAIGSLLETDRAYQGGNHTSKEIDSIIEKNPEHKRPWLREMHDKIQKIESPNLHTITELENFPNVGISSNTYDILRSKLRNRLEMLHNDGYSL
jgi:hypothetical protein